MLYDLLDEKSAKHVKNLLMKWTFSENGKLFFANINWN